MKRIFLLHLLVFLFVSCNVPKKDATWDKKVENTVSQWIHKKMYLPDSLEIVEDTTIVGKFYLKSLKSHRRLVVYIDAGCGVCLLHFEFWQKFINEAMKKKVNCDYLLYVKIDDLDTDLVRKMKFTYPFLIDNESLFVDKNELWDKRFQCALLNDKNEVILVGDPTLNPQLRELYMNVLTSE